MYPYDDYQVSVYLVPKDQDTSMPISEWNVVRKVAQCSNVVSAEFIAKAVAARLLLLPSDQDEFNITNPNRLGKLAREGRISPQGYSKWSELKAVVAWTRVETQLYTVTRPPIEFT